jgi:hypothetical protein
MAGRNPTVVTPQGAGDKLDYKPLSVLAVAGLSLAVLFAVVVALSALFALLKGEPFFLPSWSVMVPAAAAVLCGLGLWEIYNSEGTREGARMARWGIGVSLVVGAGYFTYQTFTGLAIIQQANRFMLEKDTESGFFPLLTGTKEQVMKAFLFTLPPGSERDSRPENPKEMARLDEPGPQGPKGLLTMFRENSLVRLLQLNTTSAKVEALGVRDWGYENGSYKIVRTYRISTEDGVYEVTMAVSSIEPAPGAKRTWRVDWAGGPKLEAISRTPLGEKKQGWRQRAYEFLNDSRWAFFENLRARRGMEAWLATQRPEDRESLLALANAARSGRPLLAVAGVALPLDEKDETVLLKTFLPEYRPLEQAADYFKGLAEVRYPHAETREAIIKSARSALATERLPMVAFKRTSPDDMAPVAIKNGEVLVTEAFEWSVPLPVAPGSRAEVLLIGQVVLAASEKLDPAAPGSEQQWRVVSVEITRAAIGQPKQAGPALGPQ